MTELMTVTEQPQLVSKDIKSKRSTHHTENII